MKNTIRVSMSFDEWNAVKDALSERILSVKQMLNIISSQDCDCKTKAYLVQSYSDELTELETAKSKIYNAMFL